MTRILIVEDEALIADHLAACLIAEGYAVDAILDSAEDALAHLQTARPDLALLDIQLAGALDGVDLAMAILGGSQIPVVFLTSNTDPRTLARVQLSRPAGFIVKPFQPADLRPAIELALYAHKSRQQVSQTHSPTHSQTPSPTPTPPEDAFYIKDKHEHHRVRYADILCAEALDNYTRIHLPGKRYIVSQTLKAVEEKLQGHGFFRIHRTWLVQVSQISCIRPTEVVVGELTLPTSAGARSELLKWVQTL
jgi:DNA-binding LytR/AlgR family response regulator